VLKRLFNTFDFGDLISVIRVLKRLFNTSSKIRLPYQC